MNATKVILGVVAGAGVGISAYYIFNRQKKYTMITTKEEPLFDFERAADFIIDHEGFLSKPKWDNRQWTWGYGTAAGYDKNNKPTGTITKAQAKIDLMDYIKEDYVKLKMYLSKPVTDSQMVALLDFSYNLGYGDAKTIARNINKGYTPQQWAAEMRLYNQSNGEVSDGLVTRRQDETNLILA